MGYYATTFRFSRGHDLGQFGHTAAPGRVGLEEVDLPNRGQSAKAPSGGLVFSSRKGDWLGQAASLSLITATIRVSIVGFK